MRQPKLGIQPLCDNAFGNIQSKVSTANVVTEVFSRVTAGWVPLYSSNGVNISVR